MRTRMSQASEVESNHQSSRLRAPTVSDAEFFTGERTRCRNFLLQLELVFKTFPNHYVSDECKITYMISRLRDAAFSWAAPYLESSEPLPSYESFRGSFVNMFDEPNRQPRADQLLQSLPSRQLSTKALISEDIKHLPDRSWTEGAAISMVRAALPSKIRQSIIGRNFESINDFFEVILLHDHELNAIQADDRNRGKFISHSAAKNYPPSRLPISALADRFRPLTAAYGH